SIVMLALAEKAFWPARIPFPVMHVDTGHNFGEVLDFRDRRVAELGVRLVVASVQESIDQGRVTEETGRHASRNRLQTVTLLDAVEEHRFDATVGDMTCTGAVSSTAGTVAEVITEVAATRITERGQTRADDRTSEAAMEDRKREGYF